MTASDQIRLLCQKSGISQAELARLIGKSPQSFSAKMKRGCFTISDFEEIAQEVGVTFEHKFILPNGEEI